MREQLTSCVFLFTPTGVIAWADINFPGSWHDAAVAHALIDHLLDPSLIPDPYFVAADYAFPHSGPLSLTIHTPLNTRAHATGTFQE
jgi:hypothetical protein